MQPTHSFDPKLSMLAGILAEIEDEYERRAGMMPYVVLIAGAIVVLVANWYFQLPG